MLSLPIYVRGGTYYLHTRIAGKQFKRSLHTADKTVAIVRASRYLEAVEVTIRRYEIDLGRGIFKASDEEDHKRLIETLGVFQSSVAGASIEKPSAPTASAKQGLNLAALLNKFFLLKSQLKQATVIAYKATIDEFSKFLGNPVVTSVYISDVSRYQEHLANAKKTPRTIDNKVAIIRALFNFAIKQGYYFEKNPAENRSLQSKKDKLKGGYAIFDEQEIQQIYSSNFLSESKKSDPDYYWALILGLVTGCRISEITSLKAIQFRKTIAGTNYLRIEEAKTLAGTREIPLPKNLDALGLPAFLEGKDQVFKYKLRLGKGSGNAVGKKFSRHLDEVKITRDKLVYHSLRKFLNDFFLKQDIPIEARCQFFGHDLDNVNVQTYTRKLTVDEISERVKAPQEKVLKIAGLI